MILTPKENGEQANFVGGFKAIPMNQLYYAVRNFKSIYEWRYWLLYECCKYDDEKIKQYFRGLFKHKNRVAEAAASVAKMPKPRRWIKVPSRSLVDVIRSRSLPALIALLVASHCAKNRPIFRANMRWYSRNIGGCLTTIQRGFGALIDMQVIQKLYTPIVTVRAHGAKYMWGDLDIDDKSRLLRIEQEAAKNFKYSKFIPPTKPTPTAPKEAPNTYPLNSPISEPPSDAICSVFESLKPDVIH